VALPALLEALERGVRPRQITRGKELRQALARGPASDEQQDPTGEGHPAA
jgi:hypothetical protein